MKKKQPDLTALIKVNTVLSVSEDLFHQISGHIIAGHFEAGYTFPSESDLCECLGVGRSSLREAYKMLELYGFVSRTKRGTKVNDMKEIITSMPVKKTFEKASDRDFRGFRCMLRTS